MKHYLDDEGLAKLWERIQRLVYECGGKGGSGCNCQSLTDTEIDSVTPLECYNTSCDPSEFGETVYSFTETARYIA